MLSKAEQTKQFIIEKSAPIFNTKGYAATSMNDILQATGLAKGGVYGNFKNKEEIALASFTYANEELKKALAFCIKKESTASDKLLAIINFYYNYTVDPVVTGGCPVLNTAVDADYNFPALKKLAAKALVEMVDGLAYILNKGIEKGQLKKKLDVKAEAILIYSIIEGGMVMSRLNDDPSYLNNLLDYLKTHIKQYKK